MKTYPIDGCIWCPKHYETKGTDKQNKDREHRCILVIVRKGNYKLIRYEEMAVLKDGELMSYEKFPTWCPLNEMVREETKCQLK